MHARIDALTRPHFWSLLPSTILDWVVIIVSISPSIDAPKRADTSHGCYLEYFVRRPHRTDLLSVGAHEHYSSCTSLHLRKRIATGATHHPPTWHTSKFWRPWVGPIDREWPDLWKVFYLGWNPSLQVCGRTRHKEIHAFVSGELAGWVEKTRTWQHAVKRISHSPKCARILGVLYIVEPLHSTS